jgi:hypothetical protein
MGLSRPAFLFRSDSVVNVETFGTPRKQELSTGEYTLSDIRCRVCLTVLGWQYINASNDDQKYKEGTVLIDQSVIVRVI